MKFLYCLSATLAGLSFALAKTHHVCLNPVPGLLCAADLSIVVRYPLDLIVNSSTILLLLYVHRVEGIVLADTNLHHSMRTKAT